MFECKVCGSKHERFKTIEGLYSHLERVHSDEIPAGWSVQQYAYYIKTGKTHGNCVICKGKTKFNPATGKYYRLCEKKACSDKNREIFKERMIGKYGKVSLLDDPEQQKKMLANRKISGTYTWSDGKKFTYTGSYELDFLKFLDVFLNFPSQDVECPSPHTYYYEYEGKKHFYIPDVYIQSLNLEIEVKDGGSNPNTHHKIQEVDKIKETLKDKVMLTQNAVSYVKVTNKEYDTFFKYLYKMKDQYNDKNDDFKPIFILGESSVFTDHSDIVLEASDEEVPDTQEYMFYVSNEPKLKTIRATNSKSVPGTDKVVIASPFKEFATALGVNLSKDHIKMVSTFTNGNLNIEIELLDKFAPVDNKFSIYVLNKEGFEPMERNGEKSKVRYVKKGDAEVIREIKVSNWRRYINRFTNVKLINFPNDEEAKEIAKKKVKEGYELVTESKEYPEELPQDIIDLSKTLNSYEYGVLINGKVKTGKDIDFTKYKTVSIKDFEKYHAGVCWDFVNYEAKWFKDHRYNFSTYYIEIDDNRNCPSHTFLIFNYKGKYYYFESSWVRYQGIEEFNSKMDAVNTVIKRHNEAFNKDNKYKIYCWEYNTAGLDSGLKTNDYMNKIYSSGREIKICESTDIVLVTESSKSTLDNNYKPKGKKDLSSFKRVHITEMVIDKYKKEYPFLKHVRCKDTEEYICDGYIWFDNNELVAMVGSCEYTDDKTKWVVSLEITKNYKGYGLSKQILDYAVKTMKCKYLSVNKNNKIAKKVYDDYGFKVYHEDDTMYYMTIDKNVKENLQEEYSDFDPVTEASKRKPPKIITKNLEIEKQYGVYGDGELYNAIVELKGINFKSRGRSEMLVIKDDMVYLSKSKSGELGNYSLPGGGWEPNESHDESAVRETREETRMHTKNVVYGGNYLAAYDEPNSWVKNNVEEKFQWRGYYTEVYIGEYDRPYVGHIDDVDKDDIIKTGKFYPIQEVKKLLHPIHLDIIERYMNGEIGENLNESFNLNKNKTLSDSIITSKTVYTGSHINYNDYIEKEFKDLWVSPYKGIASLFVLDKSKLKKYLPKKYSFNMGYDEWLLPVDELNQVFRVVHVNLEGIENFEPIEIIQKGYIYEIDTEKYKLYRYDWMDDKKEAVIHEDRVYFKRKINVTVKFIIKGAPAKHYTTNESVDIELVTEGDIHIDDEDISYSNSFSDVKKVVDSLSKKDLNKICNGEFKNSPYVFYREVLLVNKEPVSFIDVYKLPDMKEDGVIVIATKEKWRGVGLSARLVKRMKAKLKNKNLVWKTQKNNDSSIHLAKKMNFNPVFESSDMELVTEEAIYSSTNKYPVFIVLMHSGTTLANAIKAFTKDEFSHACISFNSKLDPLYSFGNKKVNVIDPGFVIQNSKSDFYKKHKAYYNVFVMYVDKDSYKKMKERLQYFIDNKDDLKYDLASLFKIANGKPSEESKKYFCSKFCMNVIGAGRELEKVPSLWKPEDIKGLDDISLVDKGVDFSLYDYRETEKNLDKIKKQSVISSTQKESTLTTEEREEIPNSDFGIPVLKKYPMPDEEHVRSAIRFFNYVDEEYEELLAENIKKKIKEFNMEVNVGKKNRLSKYL